MMKMIEQIAMAYFRPSLCVTGQMAKHARKAPSCCNPTAREETRVVSSSVYRKSLWYDFRVKYSADDAGIVPNCMASACGQAIRHCCLLTQEPANTDDTA